MGNLIFDTSVWINYFNHANSSPGDLLDKSIKASGPFYICPVIIQEILQGIREDMLYEKIRGYLLKLNILEIDILHASIEAAQIFRKLRKAGITVKPNDCLIAWYAIHFDLTLVHDDRGFDLIALHTPLKVLATP